MWRGDDSVQQNPEVYISEKGGRSESRLASYNCLECKQRANETVALSEAFLCFFWN